MFWEYLMMYVDQVLGARSTSEIDLFGSGGYIRAEFCISYSPFTDSHCDQHEVSFNKGLILL